jgi:hypothetical protein
MDGLKTEYVLEVSEIATMLGKPQHLLRNGQTLLVWRSVEQQDLPLLTLA